MRPLTGADGRRAARRLQGPCVKSFPLDFTSLKLSKHEPLTRCHLALPLHLCLVRNFEVVCSFFSSQTSSQINYL